MFARATMAPGERSTFDRAQRLRAAAFPGGNTAERVARGHAAAQGRPDTAPEQGPARGNERSRQGLDYGAGL